MTSLYIRLNKAAIKAKLTKNENLIFHALMIQTLGYRKSKNNLTDKRMAHLTGLRLDHFRAALDGFLNHKLFYRVESNQYDYQYRICDRFFVNDGNNTVCSPSLPNTGNADSPMLEDAPKTGTDAIQVLEDAAQVLENAPKTGQEIPPSSGKLAENSGSRGHTIKNLNIKKQQQTQTKPQTEKNKIKKITNNNTEKNMIEKNQQTTPLVSISLTGLEILPEQLVIESSQPIRLELSAKDIGKIAQVDQPVQEKIVENDVKTVADHQVISEPIEPFVEPKEKEDEIVSQPVTTTHAHAKTLAELASNLCADIEVSTQNDNDNDKTTVASALTLPTVIDAKDRNACQRHFQSLNAQQQKDVLTVFDQQLKTGSIKSKTKYFIGLAKKAQQGGLTVPSKAKQTASTTSSTIERHSPEYFAALKESNKEQLERSTLWSDYQWLQQQAISLKKSEQETATMMGMEKAYAMFGQQQTMGSPCAV